MAVEKLTLKTFLESSQFTKGAKKVKLALGSIGKAASALGVTMTATMAVQSVKAMITFAGEAEKTDLRMKRVFANMSSEVSNFSSQLSGSLGRVESDIQSGLVSFQAFFQGLGFGGREAAKYSQKMQALSLDLASFFQIQDANAQKRFLAALAGSPEVLDQFGINLKEAALQQELLNMGLSTSVQKTNEMTKTTARLSIIMRAMTENGIVGDAKRTMDTYAQQVTIAEASMKTLSIAIGQKFIPVAKGMLDVFIKLTDNITKLFTNENKLLDLNKEQQEAFLLQANSVARLVREGGKYDVILDNLIAKYPKFLGEIDKNKISADELVKRINNLNKAFELQSEIYTSNTLVAELQQKAEEARLKFLDKQTELQEAKNRLDAINLKQEQQKDKFFGKEITLRENAVKRIQEQIDGNGSLVGVTEQLTTAQNALNKALKEQNDLFEQRDKLKEFKVIHGGKDRKPIKRDAPPEPKRKGSFFQSDADFMMIASGQLVAEKNLLEGIDPIPDGFYRGLFNLSDFEVAVTKWKENGQQMQTVVINWADGFENILNQANNTLSMAFGSAIQSVIMNGGSLADAFRMAIKSASAQMSADLSMKALYHGVIGVANAILGNFVFAKQNIKASAVFAGGAVALGGVSRAVKGVGGGGMSTSSRNTGGTANSGSGLGGFSDMMSAIQGEQVFRLAGNDLVTAINRTNRFQNTIGG